METGILREEPVAKPETNKKLAAKIKDAAKRILGEKSQPQIPANYLQEILAGNFVVERKAQSLGDYKVYLAPSPNRDWGWMKPDCLAVLYAISYYPSYFLTMADVHVGGYRLSFDDYCVATKMFPQAKKFQIWGINDGKDMAALLVPIDWKPRHGFVFKAPSYKLCTDGSLFGGWTGNEYIWQGDFIYRIESKKALRCLTALWGPGTEAKWEKTVPEILGR
ncbi:MAG: hypothetical protein ACE5FU_11800, partial [Nitrospinota bacterium]